MEKQRGCIGSSLDDLLAEEGILETCRDQAVKELNSDIQALAKRVRVKDIQSLTKRRGRLLARVKGRSEGISCDRAEARALKVAIDLMTLMRQGVEVRGYEAAK